MNQINEIQGALGLIKMKLNSSSEKIIMVLVAATIVCDSRTEWCAASNITFAVAGPPNHLA